MLLMAFVAGFISIWADPFGSTASDVVGIGAVRARPADYWGRSVRVVGSVREVAANRYGLFDRAGHGLVVQSSRPPGLGAEILVVAMVGQDPENALRPLLVELDRDSLKRSLSSVLIAVGLVLSASIVGVALVLRTDRRLRRGLVPLLDPAGAGAANALLLRIEVTQGPDSGKVFELDTPEVTIGRPGERTNSVALSDLTISRRQCRIFRRAGGLVLQNESATNPTRLNGQAIRQADLLSGDRLELGDSALRLTLIRRSGEPE
jgi:hypothetical protein